MSYTIPFQQSGLLDSSGLASGATTATLTTAAFGSPTGVQLYVIDVGIPGTAEIISATVSGTSVTGITRGLSGGAAGTTIHAGGATMNAVMVPQHYDRVSTRTLGYAQDTTGAQTGITSAVDLTGLTTTVTVPTGGARILITAGVYGRSSVATDTFSLAILEGATQLNIGSVYVGDTGNKSWYVSYSVVATAGSHTYKLNFGRSSGSGTWTNAASATAINYILVQNIE